MLLSTLKVRIVSSSHLLKITGKISEERDSFDVLVLNCKLNDIDIPQTYRFDPRSMFIVHSYLFFFV